MEKACEHLHSNLMKARKDNVKVSSAIPCNLSRNPCPNPNPNPGETEIGIA